MSSGLLENGALLPVASFPSENAHFYHLLYSRRASTLERTRTLGFDTAQIVRSVLFDACDTAETTW